MYRTTRGIVIRKFNYSESALILKIFTEEFGLQSFLVKRVRNKKSKAGAALFQPLTILDFVASVRENKNMHFLKEPRVVNPYRDLYEHPVKRLLLVFLDELLYKCIKEEIPDKELFGWIVNSLTWLDLSDSDVLNYHLVFMIQLTRFLGFYPKHDPGTSALYFDLQEGVFGGHRPQHSYYVEGEIAEKLFILYSSTFDNCSTVGINTQVRRKLIDVLVNYYRIHRPGFEGMKSVEILKMIS